MVDVIRVSRDEAKTWSPLREVPARAGTRDNNGDKTVEGRQMVNAILETGGAWDQLDRTDDPVTQDLIRKTHALAFQYFERQGIDPFTERAGFERYALAPRPEEEIEATFCGT